MSATRDCLITARELLARGWCQRRYAVNAEGTFVSSLDPDAVAWCAIGAITRASCASDAPLSMPPAVDIIRELIAAETMDIEHWNDAPGRTQADVLALFDRAIAAEAGQ